MRQEGLSGRAELLQLLCFAYEVAPERDCPLLYFGKGFARNDVRSALSVA